MSETNLASSNLSDHEAYRRMALIRAFERRCLALSADGVIAGSIHLCLGQEAVPVGACAALTGADRIVATYRGHGWAIEAGVPLENLLGEICHRAGGTNGGRGGSAYLTAPDSRFYGENSIVGAGVPIASGLAMKAVRDGGVVVVSVGDGAMNQGATHEGLVFAAAKRLPLVVVCENNGWSEMTPTESMVRNPLAERVAGYGISSRVVDGCDASAVQAAVSDARTIAARGDGPVFLECRTVRLSGHYNRDIEHYRPKTDQQHAEREDPLARLRREMAATESEAMEQLNEADVAAERHVDRAVDMVMAMSKPDPKSARDHVVAVTAPATVTRVDSSYAQADRLTYQRAVNAALRAELARRQEVIVYGEDVGYAGGIFGVTRKLQKEFGSTRVFDTPISESAILGSAIGAAISGMRPIAEIMWADFLLVALDQLVNQAANVRYLHRGELNAPLVIRTQQGTTPGSCAQHSQSVEALLAHVPGLKIGLPATPHDAYAMLRAAVDDPDPCVLIESRALYQTEGPVWLGKPDKAVGGACFHRAGLDVAIITWGAMLATALEASDVLADQGVNAAVLDLRWLSPLDHKALERAVELSSGRVIVLHEANMTAGFGAEIVAIIQAQHFNSLRAPVDRVATPDVRIPAAPALQAALIPDVEQIVQRCHALAKNR